MVYLNISIYTQYLVHVVLEGSLTQVVHHIHRITKGEVGVGVVVLIQVHCI